MKKILLSLCLGLMVNWLWAQSNPQVITGATTLQEQAYNTNGDKVSLQIGPSQHYFQYSLPIPEESNGTVMGYFPWDVLYMEDTFAEETFDISKGYYGDKIQLDWSIGANKEAIDRIEIYRRPYIDENTSYFEYQNGVNVPHPSFGLPITTLSRDDFQYIDNYIEGGILYEYLVYAQGVSAIAERYITYITGIGYRNPTAVVSGNISFDGGNPVKDVVVRAEPQGAEIKAGSSIAVTDQGNLSVQYLNKNITTAATFQSWMRISETADFTWVRLQQRDFLTGELTNSTTEAKIQLEEVEEEKTLNILIRDEGSGVHKVILKKFYPTGEVNGRGDDIFKPITEIAAHFIHLSLVLNEGDRPALFINGRQLNQAFIEETIAAQQKELDINKRTIPELEINTTYRYPSTNSFNSLLIADKMNGIIDEIRLWQGKLNGKTIRQDFKRYLSGTETNLLMYLRANEGQGVYAYDLSAKGYDFNKNKALLQLASWTGNISDRPTGNQLGVLGVTDENGNYVIAAIPYTGTGESFNITPSFGVHQFEPNQQLIFLGQGAEVANKIDFKDISSFIFRGKARMDVVGTFEPIRNNDGTIVVPEVLQVKETGYNEYTVSMTDGNERTYQKGDYQMGEVPNTIVDMPNVGVEGANIYIDGNIVIGKDNKPVLTDEDGGFVIEVPIGNHYIEVKKDRHDFTYGGRFPMTIVDALAQEERLKGSPLTTEESEYITENHKTEFDFFEHQEQSVTFLDQTKVTLVGKVVGGSVEGEKPIGFGGEGYVEHIFDPQTPNERKVAVSAVNNIGQATIKLSHEAGDVTIATNKASGEYRRELAPLQYVIEKTSTSDGVTVLIDTDNISHTFLNANEVVDLRTVPTPKTSEFSLGEEEEPLVSDPYHFEKSFVYRSAPQLDVTRQTSAPMINIGGVEYYTEGLKHNGQDLVIYEQFEEYFIDFETSEVYKNYDDLATGKEVRVPITDGEFIITNNLALENTESISYNDTDKSKSTYRFKAGLPRISKPFLKTLSINYRVNNVDTPAHGYNNEGLILGGKSDGSQTFVTAAPEVPDIILRDPPGSNSFAAIEKGESISFTTKSSFTSTGGISNSLQVLLGVKFGAGGGLAGPVIESKATNNATVGISIKTSSDKGRSLKTTYSFDQTIKTSSSPFYVGADGDLYIGNSSNYFYGSYDNIQANTTYLPDSDALELHFKDIQGNEIPLFISKQKAMYFVEEPSETFFVYSQRHIIDVLIPELEQIVYNIDHGIIDPNTPGVLPRKEYLQQIALWKKAILRNEITKYKALNERSEYKKELTSFLEDQQSRLEREIEKGDLAPGGLLHSETQLKEKLDDLKGLETMLEANFEENISFDAGVGDITKGMSTASVSGESTAYNITIDESLAIELGFKFNGVGLLNKTEAAFSQKIDGSINTENVETTKVSYTLKDNDKANMLSVDVINAFDGNGPVFSTIGGRTSCPYEGISTSLFFEKTAYNRDVNEYKRKKALYDKYLDDKKKFDRCVILALLSGQIPSCTPPSPVEKPSFEITQIDTYTGDFALNYATQKVEIPLISVENANIANVPEAGAAEFTLLLENNSVSETDMDFKLRIDPATNPYNVKHNIALNGTIIRVPYGKKIPFALTLEKSVSDQYEYKDIDIVLESLCDKYNVNDRVSVSASFVPSCSKVVISKPFDNWVVNNEDIYNQDGTTNKLGIELSEFDTSFSSFKKIELQYRKSTASSWNRLHTYYKAPFTSAGGVLVDYLATAIADGEDKNSVITETTQLYEFDVDKLSLSDGTYELRAISTCSNGTQYISKVITGTVDLNKPEQFGTPSPTDGILNAGEDLRLQFSEPIQFNDAISKIEIVAETNNMPISHGVSVYFNGPENSVEIDKTNVVSGNFSIEFWMNNSSKSDAIIMQQENGFEVALIDGELVWTLGDQTIQSSISKDDVFHHYTLSYHETKGELRIYEDSHELAVRTVDKIEFTNKGRLTLGGNTFSGNLHDLRMWTKSLSLSESVANMYTQFSGSERDLIGYWPMNEGHGDVMKDLARYIHGKMEASWDIKPKTNAYDFKDRQYIELNLNDFSEFGAAKQIHDEMDITLSFWMKTASKEVATMFSNGRGTIEDLVQANGKRNKWEVGLDEEGSLIFTNEGVTYKLTETSLTDNSWHHIAMIVNRRGALKTYVDNTLVSSHSAKNIGGISGNKFWIGARGFTEVDGTIVTDRFFTGKIDEVRLWNTARTIEQLRRDSTCEIAPATLGLLLYTTMNQPELPNGKGPKYYHALSNNTTPAVFSILSSGVPNYSEDAPKLKPKRNLLSFDVRHIINGDEMIITPEISDWAVLEGQVLDITVDRIFDLAENRQASPITWTAFVERNEVSWYVADKEDLLEIEKFVGDEYEFDISLINRGGKKQTFAIKNIPNWLSLDKTYGTLDPNSKMTVKASIDPEFTIGEYIENLYLETDFGLDQKLQLNLRVLETEPDWTVNPSAFDFSMNFIGKLKINGIISTDAYDKVGAFVNGVPRGETHLLYDEAFDEYFIYLTVFSNTAFGDAIIFKAWDASQGKIVEIEVDDMRSVVFMENEVIGTKSNSALFENTNVVEQHLSLNTGWTWVSFDVNDPNFKNLNELTKNLALSTGDRILSLSPAQLETYYKHPTDITKSSWSGNISANGGMTTEKMYKLNLAKGGELIIKGEKVDVSKWSYELKENWNWLPFIIGNNTPVNEALAFYDPKDGDVIKSQNLFAIFDPINGWTGTLDYLLAGHGYMIKSGKAQTFKYPTYLSSKAKVIEKETETPSEDQVAVTYARYPENMNVILQLPKGYSKVVVYDMKGNRRGSASNQLVGEESLSFLTIYGQANEMLRFYVSGETTEEATTKLMTFSANKVVGTIQVPVLLEMVSETIDIYPNPFENELRIKVLSERSQKVRVFIHSLSGQQVYQRELYVDKGEAFFSIAPEISSGAYYLYTIVNDTIMRNMIVKK
ncbi:LamG-like jellyroll fold domain-containing protein [Aquimarina hainanensis]|uniref:LamG-like jellyroll fold domain-containing protein n=1 Tax=Aquimarina hainanensis TaxID=1578017 RepID=A0ABW5N8V7_9FLAO